MDKFVETFNLSRLNQEEIENMNRTIASSEIETMTFKLSEPQNPASGGFTGKFYQTFIEGLTPVFLKCFQKFAEKGILPSSFYEANITLIPKPSKETIKKDNYILISLMNIDPQILNKTKSNNILKGSYTRDARIFNICKSINVIYHINKLKKKKKLMIISVDAEKAFDKSQHPFLTKALSRKWAERESTST